MDAVDSLYEPLEDLIDQNDNAIERSLEWLLADLNGNNGSLPAYVEMETERQPTAHGNMNAQGEDKQQGIPKIEEDGLSIFRLSQPNYRFEVAIPEMPIEKRNEYSAVHSSIVEVISGELPPSRGIIKYNVEFTDGRQELISTAELVRLENGRVALARFSQGLWPHELDMSARKRKYMQDDEWDSGQESAVSDRMDIDEEVVEEDDEEPVQRKRSSRSVSRRLRSREHTKQPSRSPALAADEDDLDDLQPEPLGATRSLRTRHPRQLTCMSFKNGINSQEQDELLGDAPLVSSGEEDDDFLPIVSDIVPKKGRSTRSRQRSKRLNAVSMRQKARSQLRQRPPDSDIEFEAPRRSSRATRNTLNMRDDAQMDEDSFYIADDRAPGAPKIISVREIFQPLPADSEFASMHMDTCHTCGGSRQRGPMIHCQGCTLSYHKNCLGYRSAREHMVTKVGQDDFVMQCRFCIGVPNKKDDCAPVHSMCQACKSPGRSCAAFSEKKTSRQEEKLREQNGGIDPITQVPPDLLNNADAVLFRCTSCHRGWHVDHLPGARGGTIGTDLKSERLKDHSIDWQCKECANARHKIHRLVAWRPIPTELAKQDPRPMYAEVREDDKEYLIKWESRSYAHCDWKPGAWVYGVAAPTMRTSFGKRDLEQDLMKLSEREAIPDEFLMPDIVLNARLDPSAPRPKTKKDEMENLANVSKIFVKFQGLGYDDVVWDTPPSEHAGDIYASFVEAYYEYIEGKYFKSESRHKIRERVKAYKAEPFKELKEQPAGLKRGKLMGYQIEGVNWLLGNYHSGRSVVLADEMGLGKTVQVVGLVTSLVQDSPKCWPFLVVVPNATCPNWRREFKQWVPELRVVAYHGGREPQALAYKYELFPHGSADMKAHVVIMSYDSAQDPATKALFKSINWAGLVVDEGQRLKNDQNILYGALRSMRIPFRLLLTGTPLQNNKRELFNLLQFIDEKQNAEELDAEYAVLDKETLPKLHNKIRPYFLRRTKAGVLKFLPPMTQIILPVTMTVIQEKLSKSIMAKNPELIKAMFSNSKMNKKERGSLNNILMQLRKCLCHPFMYSEAIEERHHDETVTQRNLVEASAKLLLLRVMLPKLQERGHRVLIFSQFLQQLNIIEDFLSGLGYDYRRLDGSISSLEKQRRIDAFNAPDSPIFAFLLSTRAGGVGINLATADTVIILDPDFNPHQDIQALSRAHRIGQKKKVLCFQLMTVDSVEERIMQIGKKKMALDHALIESMDDDELAGDDLESILKHGAQALFNDDYEKKSIHYDSAAVDALLDRTDDTENKPDDGASFSYAKVWSNDKSGFDAGLATEEMAEPEALNSSVWDRILAQREAEAQRQAEVNREVLGRGGRRRQAINYKTNVLDNPIPGDAEAEPSDSSDDFAGGDSGEESEEEDPSLAKDAEADLQTLQASNARNARPQQVIGEQQKASHRSRQETPNNHTEQQKQQWQIGDTQNPKQQGSIQDNRTAIPGYPMQNSYHQGSGPVNTGMPIDFTRYIKGNYLYQGKSTDPLPPERVIPTQPHAPNNQIVDYRNIRLRSEAEVRVALDWVQRSEPETEARKQHKAVLLSRLRSLAGQMFEDLMFIAGLQIHPNTVSALNIMNRPSSMDLSQPSSNNHFHVVGGNGYPVQVSYGGWQQNTQVSQLSAPRGMTSGNWGGSQPAANLMNSAVPGPKHTLMSSPSHPSSSNNNGGPVSISDCLNGYAYCVKRPDGLYTRLIPADMVPALIELPATQTSAQGMVLLPDLHMQPPQGVPGMNQPVTFKAPTGPASDILQTRIDRIVATSPTQQRRTKIYCDKWIHDGTCAFTQQGCKYKHEMPFDKATQQSLGLFHGFPKWWRDHQEELQKHRNRDSPARNNQAILQSGWRDDGNEDVSHTAAVLAPIGPERNQKSSKENRLSQTREGLLNAPGSEKHSVTGSETEWFMASPAIQNWNGSSPRRSSVSAGHYIR
ncbi:CHD1-transcriptional regulator [Fusarium sp. NRRL 52700]|nr:CHD1-transcriptional regulator [Fusarium sp. NRRL 52700]